MRLLSQAYIRHKKRGPRALCALGPRFYALNILERAISLIFGLVVQTNSKKSVPPLSNIKKVHALSPSNVQILVPHFSKMKKVYAPSQIL